MKLRILEAVIRGYFGDLCEGGTLPVPRCTDCKEPKQTEKCGPEVGGEGEVCNNQRQLLRFCETIESRNLVKSDSL